MTQKDFLPSTACPETEAHAILRRAIELYNPHKVFGLFSGGHDSLCSTWIASQHPFFAGAVHINTGIGVEETREYVRETCQALGWKLREMRSPITYRSLVLKWGFPGPAGHQVMYTRLKERCLRQLVRESKWGKQDRILLVGGMRFAESKRRMGTADEHSREGCRCWCSPIVHWSIEYRDAFIERLSLPKNPVVAKLCKSGECLCGAFAKPEEFAELEATYPKVAAEIRALEVEAKAAGVHCVWGTRPPAKQPKEGHETPLFSLCWSCTNKTE